MTANVRYIVEDVDKAIAFYTNLLGFSLNAHPAPSFAILTRDELRLYLNATQGPGGASQTLPDGRKPSPGGWNRFQLEIDDLDAEVRRIEAAGGQFRSPIIAGVGGRQILVDDPSGNPIELFEARRT